MKQGQIVEAYKILLKLTDIPMDLKTAYNIMKMKRALEDQYRFEENEETKAFREWNGKFSKDRTKMQFPNPESAQAFSDRVNELKNMEIDMELNPFEIELTQDFKLSAKDMEALEGFIIFTEP